MRDERKGLVFVGVGRVGTALAVSLERRGYTVLAVEDEDPSAKERVLGMLRGANARISQEIAEQTRAVFVTTRDDAIETTAKRLSQRFSWPEDTVFVHTSGSHVSAILGARPRLSFHPLQSFAQVEEAVKRIPHSVFTLEGDQKGLEFGRELADSLGVEHVEISPEQKPLYHLAACVACNYAITLVYQAKRLLRELGFPSSLAERGLLSLLSGTVSNMERLGVERAITGPIMRGDLETIKVHLDALSREGKRDLTELYSLLGNLTAEMVLRESTCVEGQEETVKEIATLLKRD